MAGTGKHEDELIEQAGWATVRRFLPYV